MSLREMTGAETAADLFAAIRRSWAADTSVDSEWSVKCPALGQCAVTALVVQDYLGGQLVRAEVEGVSHYWNKFNDGEIDLTREQFMHFSPKVISTRSRSYVLSSPDTLRRYEILKERVGASLGQE